MRIVYIGDVESAIGFALVGARARTPDPIPDQVWPAVLEARRVADLVVLGQTHATTVLDHLAVLHDDDPVPPVVVVPSLASDAAPNHDMTRAARRVLGLA